jgi:hypothetical protein
MSIICDGCGAALRSEHDSPDEALGLLRQQIREKGWQCAAIRFLYPGDALGCRDRDLCAACGASSSAEATP